MLKHILNEAATERKLTDKEIELMIRCIENHYPGLDTPESKHEVEMQKLRDKLLAM